MTWNVIEAVVAIAAGSAAGSVALVSFGLDSTVEVGSALVIVWQFSGLDDRRERLTLRLIAVSFFALAAYVGVRAMLAGLVLNTLWGWWWADPIAVFAIAALAMREGLEAWNGDACCD